jgi:hypothetical protein
MDDAQASRARRALELGRLRTAVIGAAIVTIGLALLANVVPTGLDARFLGLPFAVWTFVAWRGGAFARGGMLGLVAGAAGWLVPMSVLRPCCAGMTAAAMAGGDCCTRPECCLEAGALLGVVVGVLAPIDGSRGKRAFAERAAGTLLVAGATLGVRCTGLFLGESLGLIGGLAIGAVIVGGVRAALTLRPAVSG